MHEYPETWRTWYKAQVNEQSSNRQKFPHDKPSLNAPDFFDPEKDVNDLRRAIKGPSMNGPDIINILTKRNAAQRSQIREKYHIIFGHDLVKDLKSELTGNFKKVIISLVKPLPLFLAEQIKHATKGVGTDEAALIEIFCTRDDDSLRAIKDAFESKYKEPIEITICSETSGLLRKLLISSLSLRRDDSASSPSAAADKLIAGVLEGDENVIRTTVTSYTFPFLKEVYDQYENKTGKDFQELIHKKFSGDTKRAYRASCLSAKKRPVFFAHALHKGMHSFGTEDWELIRIIVSRCEIDLESIKEEYEHIFGKNLVEQIKSETSSDYQTALVSLLGSE